ncbi:REX family transcriptional regulator [Thermosipho melanesiensis]|uniref:Redox-sensing transcriptional repressor Rex n=2 Tax=Thermosipho melanesiensis TaxID=46541 RepID=A6LKA5_THEM4|nr:redox-sensing transcriptional repressor Rex [Thermosipho melanesiensis]ABR30356.1 CoA-binding domain protein [Thermosipho melanesiensis BI429]APT73522.1 REX family transcriptional regulator [Thermosipho melanesiensis]OOC37472.1 REX family transcriptional regulator [Thermosipho melanesiensis]OOC39677.1 REX family transcriptional regulator [Thermosipho melanesiensis]OOC39705.1 REX family transcriptional regulator [Thermosipho melanesiensis]
MPKNDKRPIQLPRPTLERLKKYYAYLMQVDLEYISSEELAKKFNIRPEQVRKDFTYLNITGRPKIGYHIPPLIEELGELFGTGVMENIIIVGAGNLGSALAKYTGFEKIGVKVVAIFDNDPKKISSFVGELSVLPLSSLERAIKRFEVKIAAICVPEESAQKVASLLIRKGIKALWNFAPVPLKVPETIIVENQDITSGILSIKHVIKK